MSITIGKRTFFESISDQKNEHFSHSTFDLRRPKLLHQNSDSIMDSLNSKKIACLNKLETLFPNKSKNELNQLVEDFDFDSDLIIEILKKESKDKVEMLSGQKLEKRLIKTLKISQNNVEEKIKKSEMIVEKSEKKEIHKQSSEELMQIISQTLIQKLIATNDFNEGYNDVVSALKFFEDNLKKENEKTNQENKLLKKAFYKQFIKTEELQKKYEKIENEFNKGKEEMRRIQNINYNLTLMVKSLDSQSNDAISRDIY